MLGNELLLQAIRIVGSRKKLACQLGIDHKRLDKWLNTGVSMGYEYALAIEHLTKGVINVYSSPP